MSPSRWPRAWSTCRHSGAVVGGASRPWPQLTRRFMLTIEWSEAEGGFVRTRPREIAQRNRYLQASQQQQLGPRASKALPQSMVELLKFFRVSAAKCLATVSPDNQTTASWQKTPPEPRRPLPRFADEGRDDSSLRFSKHPPLLSLGPRRPRDSSCSAATSATVMRAGPPAAPGAFRAGHSLTTLPKLSLGPYDSSLSGPSWAAGTSSSSLRRWRRPSLGGATCRERDPQRGRVAVSAAGCDYAPRLSQQPPPTGGRPNPQASLFGGSCAILNSLSFSLGLSEWRRGVPMLPPSTPLWLRSRAEGVEGGVAGHPGRMRRFTTTLPRCL
mmetsp:Transcript_20230/g.46635  ORF Transcript_20230/g.46635 Transcript_20230/m.46635 type:complete len:328 (+) Transcript_20230:1267-2250(+)